MKKERKERPYAVRGGFYVCPGETVCWAGPDFELVEAGKQTRWVKVEYQFAKPKVTVCLSKCHTVWEGCYALSVNMNGYYQNESERFLATTIMHEDFKSVADSVLMSDIAGVDEKGIDIFYPIGWNEIVIGAIHYQKYAPKQSNKDAF